MASETPPCTPDRMIEGVRRLSEDDGHLFIADLKYGKNVAGTGRDSHAQNPPTCLSSVSEISISGITDSMEGNGIDQELAPTAALNTPSDSQGEPVPAAHETHTLATLIQTSATLAERLVEFDDSLSDKFHKTSSSPLTLSESGSVKRPSPPVAPPSALGIRRKIPRILGGPRLELPRLMLSPSSKSLEATDSIDKALNLADRNMEANKAALNQTRFATELTSSATDIDDDVASPRNMGLEQDDGKKVRFTEDLLTDTSMETCSSTSSEHTKHQEMIAI